MSNQQLNFREKLVARLGNAQLSDSKGGHNDSEGVLEQDNEDDQSSLMKNSIGVPRHYTNEDNNSSSDQMSNL